MQQGSREAAHLWFPSAVNTTHGCSGSPPLCCLSELLKSVGLGSSGAMKCGSAIAERVQVWPGVTKTTEGHAVQEAVLKGDQAFRGYLILSFRIFYSNMLIYLSKVNTRELTQHKVRV